MALWTLTEGIEVCRELEAALAPDYHVALGGGVLHKGESNKDLDVLIYPHKTYHYSVAAVRALLVNAGWQLLVHADEVREKWREAGNKDEKLVDVWRYRKRRVDVIYPRDEGYVP
jgi:hypothetical protein